MLSGELNTASNVGIYVNNMTIGSWNGASFSGFDVNIFVYGPNAENTTEASVDVFGFNYSFESKIEINNSENSMDITARDLTLNIRATEDMIYSFRQQMTLDLLLTTAMAKGSISGEWTQKVNSTYLEMVLFGTQATPLEMDMVPIQSTLFQTIQKMKQNKELLLTQLDQTTFTFVQVDCKIIQLQT
jgi:hypothetical protein